MSELTNSFNEAVEEIKKAASETNELKTKVNEIHGSVTEHAHSLNKLNTNFSEHKKSLDELNKKVGATRRYECKHYREQSPIHHDHSYGGGK